MANSSIVFCVRDAVQFSSLLQGIYFVVFVVHCYWVGELRCEIETVKRESLWLHAEALSLTPEAWGLVGMLSLGAAYGPVITLQTPACTNVCACVCLRLLTLTTWWCYLLLRSESCIGYPHNAPQKKDSCRSSIRKKSQIHLSSLNKLSEQYK